MITDLSTEQEFNANTAAGLVLLDFYTTWCEPCKWLDGILKEIDPELSTFCRVYKIDSEKLISVSNSFNIRSSPVLILLKNGQEVWRMNGFKLGPELVQTIRSFA